MRQRKRHNSLSSSLSLLQWLEYFTAIVNVLLEKNVLWTPCLCGGTAAAQLSHLIFCGCLGGEDKASGVEPAAGKGLYVLLSSSAPPLLSSARNIVESENGPKKWIPVIPTCSRSLIEKQNLTTAYKIQPHIRRCTVQGGLWVQSLLP